MDGIAVGLAFGIGLFLMWWSSWVPSGNRSIAATPPRVWRNLADDLVGAGAVRVGPGAFLLLCAAAGVVTFVVTYAVTSVAAIAACFAAIASVLPLVAVRGVARRRRERLREQWPDIVDNVASAVRAGLALPEALIRVGQRGPLELRPAFAEFEYRYRTAGTFNEALDALKDRLADPVADRLVESLRIAREVGGADLGRLLRTLSAFLREDARTRAEIEARQSWTVNAARLGVAAPWLVLAMLATRPESVQAYSSGTGAVILLIGAVVSIVAYRLMIRIGRLPQEQRVLR